LIINQTEFQNQCGFVRLKYMRKWIWF